MRAPRKKLSPKDRVTAEGRVLAQAYARLFPLASDRMYWFRKKVLKVSQKQLAEECDLSSSAIGNLERGYGLPKGTSLIKIGKGIGLSANYILGLEDRQELEK